MWVLPLCPFHLIISLRLLVMLVRFSGCLFCGMRSFWVIITEFSVLFYFCLLLVFFLRKKHENYGQIIYLGFSGELYKVLVRFRFYKMQILVIICEKHWIFSTFVFLRTCFFVAVPKTISSVPLKWGNGSPDSLNDNL